MKDSVVLAAIFAAAVLLALAAVLASPVEVDCGKGYRSGTIPTCK